MPLGIGKIPHRSKDLCLFVHHHIFDVYAILLSMQIDCPRAMTFPFELSAENGIAARGLVMSRTRKYEPTEDKALAERKRAPHARYFVTWYDFAWNEISRSNSPLNAHEAIGAVERWNRECQQEARDATTICPSALIAAYVSLEVVYVQE